MSIAPHILRACRATFFIYQIYEAAAHHTYHVDGTLSYILELRTQLAADGLHFGGLDRRLGDEVGISGPRSVCTCRYYTLFKTRIDISYMCVAQQSWANEREHGNVLEIPLRPTLACVPYRGMKSPGRPHQGSPCARTPYLADKGKGRHPTR